MAIQGSMVQLDKIHNWPEWLSWLIIQIREDSETGYGRAMVELPSIVEVHKR